MVRARILAALAVAVSTVPVFAESFSTDVSARWRYLNGDNDQITTQPNTPTVSGGSLNVPIPAFNSALPDLDTTATRVRGIGLSDSDAPGATGLYGSLPNDNDSYYGGSLLGNLSNRALVVTFKINIDSKTDGTAFANTDFVAGKYAAPLDFATNNDSDNAGAPNPWDMRTAPEEVRVSLYVRDRAAVATENRGGDLRWFNEAQANRMLFPFGSGNTGRSDNVYYTMVTPLNNLSQWNNYFGLGIASGSAENTADFLDTVNSIDELRFQFDSSFYGLGGFGLNENQTGTFSIDRFLSVARGDANLDGVIDTNDTLIVLANQGTGTVWQQGDFTGDGLVNGLDLAFVPAIPEPSSLALLTGAALLGLRRRR